MWCNGIRRRVMKCTSDELQFHPLVPFHPAYTHTHTPLNCIKFFNHGLLLYTANDFRCTTYSDRYLLGSKSQHSLEPSTATTPPLAIPDNTDIMLRLLLRIGLFGRTDPSLDRCWSFDHESRPTSRLCVDYRLRQYDPVPFTRRCSS